MPDLRIRLETRAGVAERVLRARALVIAGWTGRDRAAMEHHIAELEAIGVKRPPRAPMYYRAAANRLTLDPAIEVVGEDTSGEIEFLLANIDGETCVGVGSDHTDRKLETVGVTISKQACDKPIAAGFWPLREVEAHWERLLLRSRVVIDGERVLYQEGGVAGMLAPADLIRGYAGGDRLEDGAIMFGGTLAALGGVRPATRFEGELEDPVLGRRLAFAYDVRPLPDNG